MADNKDLGRVPTEPGSRPSDQAPAGLDAPRVDSSRGETNFSLQNNGYARHERDRVIAWLRALAALPAQRGDTGQAKAREVSALFFADALERGDHWYSDTNGSPEGRDRNGLDGEAATAGPLKAASPNDQ